MKIIVVWWNDSGIKFARTVEINSYTTIFVGEFIKSCENITFHNSIESFFSSQNLSTLEKEEFLKTGSVIFDNWKEK